jgi:hypothetical protein
LRSRGIDEISARKLLLAAFAGECLDRMKEDSVRTYLESLIQRHLLTLANAVAVARTSSSQHKARSLEEVG